MANDSPAKSLGDIDLSSLRVSVTRWGGEMRMEGKAREKRAACRRSLALLSPSRYPHKAGDVFPGVAFVVRSWVGAEGERKGG